MPKLADHPSREELTAYSLGQLPEEKAVAIDSHISECEPCCETIVELSSEDTFAGLLQEAGRLPTDHTADHVSVTANSASFDDIPQPLREHPRYEILGLIGKGGMGDVYKARHRKMERTVALKVINRGLVQKAEAIDRFHREVKAAAQLSHPNIVTSHDADHAGDFHFMVMEFVDGVDLSQTVKKLGALPIAEACDYIRQAALGLQHAHARGMVHRDIKPHNIMVTADGTVKILDFGLASLAPEALTDAESVEARGDLTAVGAIMGTPDFISPEQADDARKADIRSDIYSLGATLYFLLAGRPPFAEGGVTQKLKSHAQAEPEPLESLRDDVPPELVAVATKMTAKDPKKRFQTPGEVAQALKSFPRSVEPRKDVEPPPQAKPRRWKPTFLSLTAVGVLFVVALFAGVFYYVQTDHGLVRVEVTDPSLQVSIQDQTITMEEGDEKALTIRPGKQTLVVRKDDAEFEFETDRFQIRRGDKIVFKVEMLTGEIVVRKNGQAFDRAQPPAYPDPDDVPDGVSSERVNVRDSDAQASGKSQAAVEEKTTEFLIEAAHRGDLKAVKAALKAGVASNRPSDPLTNLFTPKQLTALHWAVAQRISDGKTIEPSPEIAKLLIEAGADVNAKDNLDQTPLEWAAKYGSPDIVEMLIKAGAEVNAESRYGTVLQAAKSVEIAKLLIEAGADVNAGTTMTPLPEAAMDNNLAMVRLLIEKGAKVNDPKNPPIELVGKPEVAKALLDAGADVNLRNAKGETVLHLPNIYFVPDAETVKLLIEAGGDVNAKTATGATPLHAAIQQVKLDIAKLLIAAGTDIDAKDKQGDTPLAVAHANLSWARRTPSADNKPYEAAAQVLVDAGAKDDGRTELQQAVAAGDLEQVKKLIAAKADVNETGPQQITAAHLASEKSRTEILAALIEAGAKVDAVDAHRMRPLHLAANAETARLLIAKGAKVDTGMLSPLYMATMNGKADVVRELLKNDANAKDSDCTTMLNWATFAGQLEVVKALFELRNAKTLLAVKSTYSPLHVAAGGSFGDMSSSASAQQRLDIAKLLVENGADVNAAWGSNVHPRSGAALMFGTTPLMFASQRGEAEMVKFLLDQKADVQVKNASGQTALHFAAQYGHRDVVELLLKAKADANALTREAKTPLNLTVDASVKVQLIQHGGKTASELLKDAQR